jgi:hypothetical protein
MTKRATTTQIMLAYMLVAVIAMLMALAVVHWMASCWEAGPEAMCLLPAAVRLQRLRWAWADRLWSALRAVCLRNELAWEESALEGMLAALDDLPAKITAQRSRVECVRAASIMADNAARGDA